MKKKKYKINWKKFIIFLLVLVLIGFAASVAIAAAKANPREKKVNPKKCSHVFENGVCTICGGSADEYCVHEYDDGVCKNCGKKCEHDYEENVCKICGRFRDPKELWPYTTTPESAYPLAKADEDYLVLVNKKWHLQQSYVPDDLVVVEQYVEGVGDPSQYTNCMRKVAADALNEMIRAAAAQGISLKLRTGYRSYDYQVKLFNSYVVNHGEAQANLFSAKPGESEHQTGLACDLGGASQGYALSDYFGDTPEGKWVKEHCSEYGFILRYIDGGMESAGIHTGYTYEAWHVRYVGKEAAQIITQHGWTFEEYLEAIKEIL